MNKRSLIEKIIARLAQEIDAAEKSARAAHAEATHEQNKAENKYDTRALEASYLAHGQSRQAAETAEALQHFQTLRLRDFGPRDAIDLGALVELESGSERSFYLIGPRAGGTEIAHEEKTVLVLTSQSPLGRHLMGRKQGDHLRVKLGDSQVDYRIVAVI